MRRRRSSVLRSLSLGRRAASLVAHASHRAAQTGTTAEGALEFLLPTGARAVGMGQAVVAVGVRRRATLVESGADRARPARESAFNIAQQVATA